MVSGCQWQISPSGQFPSGSGLAGTVMIEGSSTVEPIANQAKEQFNLVHPRVNVSISGKGTGNGIAALIKGEVDIANASRPIKSIEFAKAIEVGRDFYEIPIAYDGLTFVVNRANTFVQQLTVEQLTQIFREDWAARTWSEIDPGWPNEPITVYAPGIASGTHDCFVDVISRDSRKGMRSDERTILSEDDKLLVRGVKEDQYSIGFFGYNYFLKEQASLRAIKIVNEAGQAVEPNRQTILGGRYSPFGRPLFLYVSAESYQRVEVREFVNYQLAQAAKSVDKAGFVPLAGELYLRGGDRLEAGPQGTGTHYLQQTGMRRDGLLSEIYLSENLRRE
jgi:phosphate transport system substrate-binding protein